MNILHWVRDRQVRGRARPRPRRAVAGIDCACGYTVRVKLGHPRKCPKCGARVWIEEDRLTMEWTPWIQFPDDYIGVRKPPEINGTAGR